MLWFNVKASIPDNVVGNLKILINIPTIAMYIGAVLIIIGSACLLAAAAYYLYDRHQLPPVKIMPISNNSFEIIEIDLYNNNLIFRKSI